MHFQNGCCIFTQSDLQSSMHRSDFLELHFCFQSALFLHTHTQAMGKLGKTNIVSTEIRSLNLMHLQQKEKHPCLIYS